MSPERFRELITHITGRIAGKPLGPQLEAELNQSFPASGGMANPVVTGLLEVCGVTIVTALVLTLVGLARAPKAQREVVREFVA